MLDRQFLRDSPLHRDLDGEPRASVIERGQNIFHVTYMRPSGGRPRATLLLARFP